MTKQNLFTEEELAKVTDEAEDCPFWENRYKEENA